MKTEVIVIENERDLRAARALISALGRSRKASDIARLRAQALLLEAYETARWPSAPVSPAELIRYAMEQHGLTAADDRADPRHPQPGQRNPERKAPAYDYNDSPPARPPRPAR